MEREQFGSRLGFILVSAGCAIGLGNVWKFPYICGENGGAAFILIYLAFLLLLGLPILICEFAIGRGSKRSIARSFDVLEEENSREGQAVGRYHHFKYFGIAGNYLLMMFYTMVGGWMVYYAFLAMGGKLAGKSTEEIGGIFGDLMGRPEMMIAWTYYMKYILPIIIIGVYIKGYYDMFAGKEGLVKYGWMAFGALFLGITLHMLLNQKKNK